MEKVNSECRQEPTVAARPQRAEVIAEESPTEKIAREKWEKEVKIFFN
jgi:hypothetical protein